jgi:integrase/recombinase XerC
MNKLLTCVRQPLPAFAGIPNEQAFLTIRDRAMLEVLYAAALRVSELCGMNWQDINWNRREVTVTGKGNKTRICPLGQKALEALLEYSRHYEQQWKRKPEGPAAVFLGMWNRRLNQRTIPRTITKWCHAAGVKRVHPHAFRHSCATHMLENGADIRTVQELLGHANLNTTQIYARVTTQKLKSVHANTHPRA